jgi:hypothetical protein
MHALLSFTFVLLNKTTKLIFYIPTIICHTIKNQQSPNCHTKQFKGVFT